MEHTHSHDQPERKIDAGRVIRRLQNQRTDLQSQMDVLEAALEEAEEKVVMLEEQVQKLLSEDKKKEPKS